MNFLPFATVAPDKVDNFRFGSKCVPCNNVGQDLTNPRWGPQLNYCTDCTKTTTPPRQIVIPAWTLKANGTFSGTTIKWLNPAGTPFSMADECALLASRDATCSKFVMFSATRSLAYSGASADPTSNAVYLNGTSTYKLFGLVPNPDYNRYFTDYSFTSSYYRSCACFQGTTTTLPAVDSTGVANACEGVAAAQCKLKGFQVFQLA